ncbi:MAG: hypothetical protein U1E65_23095 [Myxococcota bacterium]
MRTWLPLLLLTLGCAQDLKPLRQQWDSAVGEWNNSLGDLRRRQADLAKKVAALPSVEDEAQKQAKTALEALLTAQTGALSTIDLTLRDAKRSIDEAQKSGRIGTLTTAMNKAKDQLLPALAQLKSNLEEASQKYEALSSAAQGTAAEAEKKVAEVAAWIAQLTEATKRGGKLELYELHADGPRSAEALEEIAKLAKTCPELKLSLIDHAAKDADPKTLQKRTQTRIDAIKKALIAKGVKATQIQKAVGVGAKAPLVPEPEPGSKEERSMDPQALAAARQKNDRVTVEVTRHCK